MMRTYCQEIQSMGKGIRTNNHIQNLKKKKLYVFLLIADNKIGIEKFNNLDWLRENRERRGTTRELCKD